MEGQRVEMQIDAPPEVVYELVSDVTRMGEWSPVCQRCEWTGGSTGPEEGATFRGYNKQGFMRWNRDCRIHTAERGKEFSFSTYVGDRESTHWTYTFEPSEGGTRVVESYEPKYAPLYVRIADALMSKKVAEDGRKNIETSLRNLKAAAEREAASAS